VFLPDLARSLNNLSLRLADLGRREQALTAVEEAVTIRRIHSGLLLMGDVGFGVGSPGCGSAAVIV
jgi:hypothetical protein